jgi:hypothetical protein
MQSVNWFEIIAYLINSVLVVIAVEGLKKYWPSIKDKYGFLIPIIAPIAGLAINTVAKLVSDLIGYPVDFSPIIAIITGTTAVWVSQVGKQIKKGN